MDTGGDLMSKYLNRKTEADDIVFDSKKEAQTYLLLKARQNRGEISNLARQVPFVLIKKSKYGRTIKYIADFVFTENNKVIVMDVKSYYTRKNPVYRLKKRMMAEIYGIEITQAL